MDIELKSPTENSFFLSMGGVVLVWMFGFFWRFGGGICTHSDGQPVALYGSGLPFDVGLVGIITVMICVALAVVTI